MRRGFSISSPIVDADSTPVNANAIVDSMITSLSDVPGTTDANVIGVADPWCSHE